MAQKKELLSCPQNGQLKDLLRAFGQLAKDFNIVGEALDHDDSLPELRIEGSQAVHRVRYYSRDEEDMLKAKKSMILLAD
jgi:hypothetical protein